MDSQGGFLGQFEFVYDTLKVAPLSAGNYRADSGYALKNCASSRQLGDGRERTRGLWRRRLTIAAARQDRIGLPPIRRKYSNVKDLSTALGLRPGLTLDYLGMLRHEKPPISQIPA